MNELVVKGLDIREWGTQRVRLNISHRNGVPRYGIARIINNENGKSILTILLGHDNTENIYMDYDTRDELGVRKGATLDFAVGTARLPLRVWWYLTIKDPTIRIPAWLAVWSVVLGVAGIGLGAASILCP